MKFPATLSMSMISYMQAVLGGCTTFAQWSLVIICPGLIYRQMAAKVGLGLILCHSVLVPCLELGI